jgi:hypothetical protein
MAAPDFSPATNPVQAENAITAGVERAIGAVSRLADDQLGLDPLPPMGQAPMLPTPASQSGPSQALGWGALLASIIGGPRLAGAPSAGYMKGAQALDHQQMERWQLQQDLQARQQLQDQRLLAQRQDDRNTRQQELIQSMSKVQAELNTATSTKSRNAILDKWSMILRAAGYRTATPAFLASGTTWLHPDTLERLPEKIEKILKANPGLLTSPAMLDRAPSINVLQDPYAEVPVYIPMPLKEALERTGMYVMPSGKFLSDSPDALPQKDAYTSIYNEKLMRWEADHRGMPVPTEVRVQISEQARKEALEDEIAKAKAIADARRDPDALAIRLAQQDLARERADAARQRADEAFNERKQKARDAAYNKERAALDKLRQPMSQQLDRLNRVITSARQGNAISDSLIAPELLTAMAGGQGSGLRMNEAEISRIIGGRTAWEDLRARLNYWAANPQEAQIPPEQRAAIVRLAEEMKQQIGEAEALIVDTQTAMSGSDDPQQIQNYTVQLQRLLHQRSMNVYGGGAVPNGGAGADKVRSRKAG